MPETAHAKQMIVKYSGIFDFQGLYSLIVNWLKDNGYEMEESFKYKNKEFGYEVELKLSGWRKENEYVKVLPSIFIQVWGMKDVEVNKKKVQKGRLRIIINGKIEMDYAKEYEKNAILKELRKWYQKYIFSSRYDQGYYWDRMYFHMVGLQNQLKGFLGMEATA